MNLSEIIYIIGHKRPDLDSIASPIGYQEYMNSKGFFNYYAVSCEDTNQLTKWVFKRFDTKLPELIPNISGMNIILVDHSEQKQRPNGWERANILEVIDHHEPDIQDLFPVRSNIQYCGATSSIIAKMIFDDLYTISPNIAGILLSAILDDTLGLESPTTSDIDIDMAYTLADISSVKDINTFYNEIISKKDIWSELTTREIIETDMKEIEINGKNVSISQVETMNNIHLHTNTILEDLKKLNDENPFDLRIVMLTDLQDMKSILLIVGEDLLLFEKALGKQILNNVVTLSNVVSRKKQVVPIINRMYI